MRGLMSFDAAGNVCIMDLGNSGVAYPGAPAVTKNVSERLFPKKQTETERKESFASALRPSDNIPENVSVNPEDYYETPFRLLSATIVGANTWKATDFTNEAVLRASVDMLKGKPVYTEHWMYTGNWAGVVRDTVWTNSFIQDGTRIPGGIDGILAIDTTIKRNEELAKGINVGAITSNSVTIEFEWEKSHEMEDYMFYNSIGDEIDGEMVRRVVTKILGYHETSLVGLGADPFAKRIDANGNLVNIDKTAIAEVGLSKADRTGFSKEQREQFLEQVKSAKRITLVEDPFKLALSLKDSPAYLKEKEEIKKLCAANFDKTIAGFGQNLGGKISELIDAMVEGSESSKTDVLSDLSEHLNITASGLRKIISGTTECPSLDRIGAICEYFGADVKELVSSAEKDGCTYEAAAVAKLIESGKDGEEDGEEDGDEMKDDCEEYGDKGKKEDEEGMGDDEKEDEEMKETTSNGKTTQSNGEQLGDVLTEALNQKVEDTDWERAELVSEIAERAEKSEDAINAILRGETQCPDDSDVSAFKAVLKEWLDETKLESALIADGCKEEGEQTQTSETSNSKADTTELAKAQAEIEKLRKEIQTLKASDCNCKETTSNFEKVSSEMTELKKQHRIAAANLERAKKMQANFEEVKLQLTDSNAKIDQLKEALQAAKADEELAKIGKAHLEDARQQAIKFANLSAGGSDKVVEMINEAKDIEAINALINSFGGKTVSKFEVRCNDCQSTNCGFGSVRSIEQQKQASNEKPLEVYSSDDIRTIAASIKK